MNKKIAHLKKELRKAKTKLAFIQAEKEKAEDEAAYYKKRFRDFGSNVETFEPSGCGLTVWKVDVIPYGMYCYIADRDRYDGADKIAERHLADALAEALIKRNLVQFIYHRDPLNMVTSIGAKLFVVPWEQTPHPRTLTIRHFIAETMKPPSSEMRQGRE